MNLFIIEAPGKIRTLKRILEKKFDDFDIKATFGQIYDTPKNKLGIDFSELKEDKIFRNPQVIEGLRESIDKSSHIYVMTDYDEVGEQIGRDIIDLFDIEDRYSRIYINSFSEKDIIYKIEKHKESKISKDIAETSDARRIINKVIGYSISDNGFERSLPIGTTITPLINKLNDPNNIVGNINTYMNIKGVPYKMKADYPRRSINNVDEIKGIFSKILERTLKSPYSKEFHKVSNVFSHINYYELIAILSEKYSLKDIQELCQKSYQSGNISYFRTDSKRDPKINLKDLKDKYGKLNDVDLDEYDVDELEEIKENNENKFTDPHSSIYPEKNNVNIFDEIDFISENKEVAYYVEKLFLLSKSNADIDKIKIKAKILKEEDERLKYLGVDYNSFFEVVRFKNKKSIFEKYYDPDLSKTSLISKRKINGVFDKRVNKEFYCLKELYSLGIAKPSTMVEHSINGSKFLNDDYSINKKARISLSLIEKKLPFLLNIEKIKDMENKLKEGSLEDKVKQSMIALGMDVSEYFKSNVDINISSEINNDNNSNENKKNKLKQGEFKYD